MIRHRAIIDAKGPDIFLAYWQTAENINVSLEKRVVIFDSGKVVHECSD